MKLLFVIAYVALPTSQVSPQECKVNDLKIDVDPLNCELLNWLAVSGNKTLGRRAVFRPELKTTARYYVRDKKGEFYDQDEFEEISRFNGKPDGVVFVVTYNKTAKETLKRKMVSWSSTLKELREGIIGFGCYNRGDIKKLCCWFGVYETTTGPCNSKKIKEFWDKKHSEIKERLGLP